MKLLIMLSMGIWAHAADPVQLKTGPELLASYAAITGVSANDPDIHTLYLSDVKRLPQKGTPDEMSNNVVLAATEVGGLFCQKALAREQTQSASQRILFTNADFTRGPSQFDSYTQGQLFETLALAFWFRDVTDAEKQSLAKTLAGVIQNQTDTPDQTVRLMQLMCTVYASSVAALVK
jgi:hypothetical protein